MAWKSLSDIFYALEKYKKLNQYTARILKKRHIPSIKIHKSGLKKSESTEKLLKTRESELSTINSNTCYNKVHILRSTSNIKPLPLAKPCDLRENKNFVNFKKSYSDEENKIESKRSSFIFAWP